MNEFFLKMSLAFIFIVVLLNGCASDPFVRNIKSTSDLKANEKILAGRFACFENDAPVHCTKSGFFIFFNKEGELQAKLLRPDDAGYVFVPVTEGYYYFATFGKEGKDQKGLIFDLDPFPVVLVRSEDSVVNFGTFEVRFYDRPMSKGPAAQPEREPPQLGIKHLPNYEVTRSEIASRVGKFAGPISDGSVQSLQRARR